MGNIWIAQDSQYEYLDEFLSRDFDAIYLHENFGYLGTIYVYDKSDRMRPICRIEDRNGRAWIQPVDSKGNPVAYSIN